MISCRIILYRLLFNVFFSFNHFIHIYEIIVLEMLFKILFLVRNEDSLVILMGYGQGCNIQKLVMELGG